MNRRLLLLLLLGTTVGVLLILVSVLANVFELTIGNSYLEFGVLISVISVTGGLLTISQYIPTLYKVVQSPGSFFSFDFELVDRIIFWEFWTPIVENEEMVVVYPNREKLPGAPAKITNDVRGIIALITGLNTYFKDVDYQVIDDLNFSTTDNDKNIVCVGGPFANDISYQILHNTDVPITFHKVDEIRDMMYSKGNGDITQEDFNANNVKDMIISREDDDFRREVKKYPDSTPNDPKIEYDWGIITRIPSPYNNNRIALNVAGVFAPGTYAGFEILTSPEYLEEISEIEHEFFQIIYGVSVDRNGVINSPDIEETIPLDDVYN